MIARSEAIANAIELLQDYLDEDITTAKKQLITTAIIELKEHYGLERLCIHCEQKVAFSCPYCGAIDE